MKTVSTEFLNEQAGHHFKYYRHVTLYRRAWNGSAYALDGGTNIDSYVIRTGKIVASVDIISNEWKTGNFDITVKNISREWSRNNPDGLWWGYLPEFSEIKVEFGYIDSGDVERGVSVFGGVITFEGVKEDLEGKTATLHVRGYQDILDKYSSEEMADNQVTGSALIGAVNGINTTFTTTDNGVGIINAIYHDGTEYEVDTYTASNLNVKDSPATIEMDVAPLAGIVMTTDYVKWYQDKEFKYLIEKLLDHSTITDRDVQEVTFPGNVGVDFIQETDAHFNAGTMDGDLYVKNNALNMAIAKQLQYRGVAGFGSGSFDILTSDILGQSFKIGKSGTISKVGFYCYWQKFAGQISGKIVITIRTDDAGHPSGTILATEEYILSGANYNSGSKFIEKEGFDLAIAADTTYWICFVPVTGIFYLTWMTLEDRYSNGYISHYNSLVPAWQNYSERDLCFYVRYAADNYKWMSVTEDCGVNLQSWGTLDYSAPTLGTYTFYTRTQDADAGWPVTFDASEWDVTGLGGIINSELKRYLRVAVRIQYNPQIYDLNQDPLVPYINIRYYTSTFGGIKLANYTGQSVRGSIREKAIICDYQYGFTALKKFFFRAKELSPPVDLYLYGVTKILNYKVYWNLLRNKVTATFGNYSKTISSITEGEASPHSIDKFGVRPFSISGGNLLNDDNVDVASGAAQRYYDNYNQPKRGCRFSCKSFAQLDLGDIIVLQKTAGASSVTLFDNHLFDDYLFGNEYAPPYELKMRIIKLTADTDFLRSGGMEIEAMEV